MSIVEAEREIADRLAHADFEIRMGTPPHMAHAGIREAFQDALVELARLKDEHDSCEDDLKDAKDDAKFEEEKRKTETARADDLQERLDERSRECDSLRAWRDRVVDALGLSGESTSAGAVTAIAALKPKAKRKRGVP